MGAGVLWSSSWQGRHDLHNTNPFFHSQWVRDQLESYRLTNMSVVWLRTKSYDAGNQRDGKPLYD
jgi:hypothetical protein